ncbi:MAG TPA: flagellar hook-basal body complex protein FliE [Burkholderiaceae bacterium]|nr:flagellar hook-basal body complex protein FliE [Burkholderiaceae bacterium]
MSLGINSIHSQALAQLAAQRLLNPGITSAAPQNAIAASKVGAPVPAVTSIPVGKTEATFSTAFKNALTAVSAAQNHASQLQNKVQMGEPGASLEETMIAMQKAQIGFQTALNVRNRMVQAYSDIMNMQV